MSYLTPGNFIFFHKKSKKQEKEAGSNFVLLC